MPWSVAALLQAGTAGIALVIAGAMLPSYPVLLLGSVSSQVLQYAPCPVTVVR